MRTRGILPAALAMALITGIACSGGDKPSRDEAGGDPTSTAVARPQGSSRLDWESCEGFECATLDVPLDYGDPDGAGIEIAVVRRKAPRSEPWSGVLLVNPGGPGSSGADMARNAEYIFPREIIDRFDIIGFDPRGVGQSSPIDCGDEFDAPYPLDFTPDDAGEREAIVTSATEFAEACSSRNRERLPHMGTVNAARDMDRLREALGVDQITYFGWSYGTLLGAIYADMFPDRIRAMALDGGIDPELTFEALVEDEAEALDVALAGFLDDCKARRACDFYSAGNPAAAFDDLMRRIEHEPLPALYYDEGVTVVPDDAVTAVVNSLYDQRSWVELSLALVQADQDEDGTGLLDVAYPASDDEEESNYGDANAAILCADEPVTYGEDEFHEASRRLTREYGLVGGSVAYYSLICIYWPESRSALPAVIDLAGVPPVLVIATRRDPATPYKWSEALAAKFDESVLITFEGDGHTAAFANTSTCVDELVLLYLVDLVVPESDQTCD